MALNPDNLSVILKACDNMLRVSSHTRRAAINVASTSLGSPKPIPPLYLELPSDILSIPEVFKCPDSIKTSVLNRLIKTLDELRDIHQSRYDQTCHRLLQIHQANTLLSVDEVMTRLRSTYQDSYFQRCQAVKCSTIERLKRYSEQSQNADKGGFKRKFIPLLEKYFEYNAYPSVPDRLLLARKCMMTPRQIEVWFQNHRNRAKQEGKGANLRRLQSHQLPFNISLGSLEQQLPTPRQSVEPETDVIEGVATDIESEEPQDVEQPPVKVDVFDAPAPLHAYPANKSFKLNYHPFPKDDNDNIIFKCAPLAWMRAPATKPVVQPSINFDEFIDQFASKLHLRERARRKKSCDRDVNSRSNSGRWNSSTVTIPSPAPLPALIRSFSTTASAYSSHVPRRSRLNKPRSSSSLGKGLPSTNYAGCSNVLNTFSTASSRNVSSASTSSSTSEDSSKSSSSLPSTPPSLATTVPLIGDLLDFPQTHASLNPNDIINLSYFDAQIYPEACSKSRTPFKPSYHFVTPTQLNTF